MRKLLAILCAAMLCACCLVLAACGGSSSSSAASASGSSTSASAESASASEASESASASSAADPKDNFVGEWKVAAAEFEGVTITGDFSSLFGDAAKMSFTINADGTGTATASGDTKNLTWVQKDDNTIVLTVEGGSAAEEAKYENGTLSITMNDSEANGTIILSRDGTVEGISEIKADEATPITSQDALIGDWSISGVNMMGMSMYGSKEALAAVSGNSDDMTISFKADGTGTVMGEEVTWKVDDSGASVEMGKASIPVKALGDDVVIDVSSVLGMNMVMVFSK